jgi:hypothetical protein
VSLELLDPTRSLRRRSLKITEARLQILAFPERRHPALRRLRHFVQAMESLVDLGELVLEIPNPTVIVSLGFNQCRDLSLKILDRVVHVVRPGFPCRFLTARVFLTITSSRS